MENSEWNARSSFPSVIYDRCASHRSFRSNDPFTYGLSLNSEQSFVANSTFDAHNREWPTYLPDTGLEIEAENQRSVPASWSSAHNPDRTEDHVHML